MNLRASSVTTPITFNEDGWIVDFTAPSSNASANPFTLNGTILADVTYRFISFSGATPAMSSKEGLPYPVAKGDILNLRTNYATDIKITFAPCRGNSAKTN